jgi:aspartyl-tRNA(Asn)/glutamyl-tRNA(Gln) amidotransferase subunit A
MKPLHELTLAEAGKLLRDGRLSSEALTLHALERIALIDPLLHSFILVTRERALDDAARADRELRQGIDKGPLHGIPYAHKDVFYTAGIATTCNSWLMKDHIPDHDCFVETKLKQGGGVLLGKLATHEFALGGPGFDLPFPPASNPWNPEHFTGASSSGSGAAVAAGLVRIATGTDTSGSIRGPAAHCGVVGIKPSFGLVSRHGVFPLSYSLDHCGVLGRTVEDAALALNVLAGHDPRDLGSVEIEIRDYASQAGQDILGLKIGYARPWMTAQGVSGEVLALMDAAAEQVAKLGASVEEAELPPYDLFNACGRIIMTAEGYAIHEKELRNRPAEYGRYTYQRLAPGAAIGASDLLRAYQLRRELAALLNGNLLSKYDALITAASLYPAASFSQFPEHWPPPGTATATQTIPFNITGNPALVVPAGFSREGLPVGLQIVGRAFDEQLLFRIGAAYESAAGFVHRWPAFAPEAATQ